MPKMGKVCITHSYIVNLNDRDQVDDAKEALYEDIVNAVKYGEAGHLITTVEDDSLTMDEIPEFLQVHQDLNCKECECRMTPAEEVDGLCPDCR